MRVCSGTTTAGRLPLNGGADGELGEVTPGDS